MPALQGQCVRVSRILFVWTKKQSVSYRNLTWNYQDNNTFIICIPWTTPPNTIWQSLSQKTTPPQIYYNKAHFRSVFKNRVCFGWYQRALGGDCPSAQTCPGPMLWGQTLILSGAALAMYYIWDICVLKLFLLSPTFKFNWTACIFIC